MSKIEAGVSAEELMIGNLVRLNNPTHQKEFTGRVCEVMGVQYNHPNGVVVWLKVLGELPIHEACISEICQLIEFIKPIEISPEILEGCGFVKENQKHTLHIQMRSKQKLQIEKVFTGAWDASIRYGSISNVYLNDIRYVHQLQNLFLTITGERLVVKI